MSGFLSVLRDTRAQTDPSSSDRKLRGRTYAIPFDRVWTAALSLARDELRRWELISEDDQKGIIDAVARSWPRGKEDDVHIRVGLDANGQTRVDLTSASRTGSFDLGRNRRRIGSFLKKLDRRLDATQAQILDPTHQPTWTS